MILTSEVLLLGKEQEVIKTDSGLCVVIIIAQTKFTFQRRVAGTVYNCDWALASLLSCQGRATAAGLANEVL